MSQSPSPAPFRDIALAHAVRLLEEAGALDDAGEMTLAHARQHSEQDRILERARLLGARLGLLADWSRLRGALWLSAGLSVLLAYGLAGGLLAKALGTGQTINAALAFVAVLGVPVLALLLWLVWALGAALVSNGSGPWSLGQFMLGLAARLPWLHGPHSMNLLRGIHAVLRDNRLGLWLFGAISHALWALAFALMLLTLLVLFSFQSFQLTWETTILDAGFFERFLEVTGWLPKVLGFVVPDGVALNGTADMPGSAQPSLPIALWLLACTLLYGFLPRLLALVVCAAVWFRRSGQLSLDTRDPYFRQLAARFSAMAPATVVDEEHAAPREPGRLFRALVPGQPVPRVMIGFELSSELDWPPTALAGVADQTHAITGTMTERLQLLTALASAPPAKALILCSAATSPDRGAERFLRQVCAEVASCALLPVASRDPQNDKPERWAAWLAATGLKAVALCATAQDAQQWLEANDHG
ncbi:hypothetical protein LPB72_05290 [Hydrogenophaga crassostreae]|uniref:DUF2868 domain-containing protein n=1 Tax=Hydrogenophaga crassostreae TaxID=1763535 RepID=A0A167INN1_9BURK|nr:DUF2868 domain-containing protein [Hydrogenophaga crassostreae]AOW14645.1 hypothetical protein LPB072_19260 [Hydrogenophaga crassostreae]OAD43258.1 hypothetical protein LPB72_05290 [Hydrogenophaga crassostreae]